MTEQPETVWDFLAEELRPAPAEGTTDKLLIEIMPKIAALGSTEAMRLFADGLAIVFHADFPSDEKSRARLLTMFSGFVAARVGQLEAADAELALLPADIKAAGIQ